MADSRGAFGIIGPRYQISDAKVVMARRWAPLALGVALPIGVWMVIDSFKHHGSSNDTGLGVVLALFGGLGILSSPLKPPARIEVTPGLIVAGGKRYTKDDIGVIDVVRTVQRGRYGGTLYHQWSLAITLLNMKTVGMLLRRGGEHVPADVKQLLLAARAVFGATSVPA